MGKHDSHPLPVAQADNSSAKIEYWKQGISVSMHFNDMCIRLRILCLTVLATFFAGAALSMAQYPNGVIRILWFEAHISAALYMIALIFVCSLWLLDQFYYYRMLIASVENSEHVEPKVKELVYDLVEADTITQRLTLSIPRQTSREIANVFYGVQALIALSLIVLAWAAPGGAVVTRADRPAAPAIILAPPSAHAEPPPSLDLRGRAGQ
jgi:hypothetical protein